MSGSFSREGQEKHYGREDDARHQYEKMDRRAVSQKHRGHDMRTKIS